MKIVQTGGKPVEYRAHAVAVYEPGSGRVLHVHHTLRLAGRPAPPAAGLEEEALAHAAGLGHAATGLRALVLEEVPAPGAYRVDARRRALVPRPLPKARRRTARRKRA